MKRLEKLPKPSPNVQLKDLRILGDGYNFIRRGYYSVAENYLTRMAFKYPDENFMLVLALADAKFLQGKLEDAEKLYRDSIEVSPAGYAHHGLALILLRTGRAEEAEQHIKIATSLGALLRAPDYMPPLE